MIEWEIKQNKTKIITDETIDKYNFFGPENIISQKALPLMNCISVNFQSGNFHLTLLCGQFFTNFTSWIKRKPILEVRLDNTTHNCQRLCSNKVLTCIKTYAIKHIDVKTHAHTHTGKPWGNLHQFSLVWHVQLQICGNRGPFKVGTRLAYASLGNSDSTFPQLCVLFFYSKEYVERKSL